MTTGLKLQDDLCKALPGLRTSVQLRHRRAYSRDCWPVFQARYWEKPVEDLPAIVVWPADTNQICELFRFANNYGIPVTPIGLGSGVVGGGVPDDGAIVIDLKHIDQAFELDKVSSLLTADVGWNGQRLEDRLNQEGFTGGHFPSSIMMSSLGGWMAARGAGQLSTRYGKFEDRLRGCQWVFPDGKTRWVDCDYPDDGLLELLTGSEGTLGVATKIQFRVDPLPQSRQFAAFDFESVSQAIDAMRRMLQQGVCPAAVRLYDPLDTLLHTGLRRTSDDVPSSENHTSSVTTSQPGQVRKLLQRALRLVLDKPAAAQQLLETFARKSMLVLMFEGPSEFVTWQKYESVKILSESGKSLGETPAKAWFAHRYSITGKQTDVVGAGGFFDTMEVAFPWSKLHDGYQAVRKALHGQVLLMAHFSHVYHDGGCIYFSFVGYKSGRLENERHYQEVWRLALDAVVRAGGTITHHHGVGLLKAKWMADEWQGGHRYLQLLKRSMDSQRIANPGKLGI